MDDFFDDFHTSCVDQSLRKVHSNMRVPRANRTLCGYDSSFSEWRAHALITIYRTRRDRFAEFCGNHVYFVEFGG